MTYLSGLLIRRENLKNRHKQTVNNNTCYQTRQHMLHVSVATDRTQAFNIMYCIPGNEEVLTETLMSIVVDGYMFTDFYYDKTQQDKFHKKRG